MKRTTHLLAVFLLLAWRGASAQKVQNEGLVRDLGPDWKTLYEISPDARYNLIELVPGAQSFLDWKEVVRISDFNGASDRPAEDLLKEHQAAWEKKCPGTMHWSVISRDATGVTFQWHSDPCDKLHLPEEDEVGRVILGRYSRYMLEYSARVHELASETRAQWLKTFAAATFDSITLCFDPKWMSVDVDEPVAYPMDKVMAALETVMPAQDCHVTGKTADKIECKRPRTLSSPTDPGGESVTGVLSESGSQTQVRITTGRGFNGHFAKKNWSTPMFEAMMKELQGAER